MSLRGLYTNVMDMSLNHALLEIKEVYGHTVDIMSKAKGLSKFGENTAVGTAFETVAGFQSTVANETYVSTNIIDTVISSSASDTQTVTIEGHTIDTSGNLTFSVQTATLTGQTPVTLTTPIARANRIYIGASGTFNSPQAAAVGIIAVYDNTDGQSAGGVPTTAAATKILIPAAGVQSQKCATSISSVDYWILTDFEAHVGGAGGNAAYVDVRVETRDVANGGLWRPLGNDIVIVPGAASPPPFKPIPNLIVPPNHDVRVRAKSDSNSADVTAEVTGYLAHIISR